MEVLACTTRKNKLIHASASRLGPEKLALSWVRTILNSRMRMVKFCRSSQKQRKIFVSETWKQTNQQKSEKRNKEKWSFLRERLNRTLTWMEKIWEIQKGSTIFLHSFNINVTSLRTFSKIITPKKLLVTAIPAKIMELTQMKSTDIIVAVHQDFTGRSVKRLKACLVHRVCREVYRILMTYSESFLLQFRRTLVEMRMTN